MSRINLAPNPSAKDSTTSWSIVGTGTIVSRDTSTAWYGATSFKIAKAAVATSGITTTSRIAVTTGTSYAASVYVAVPPLGETSTLRLDVSWYTALTSGTFISTTSSFLSSVLAGYGFTRLEIVDTAPVGAVAATITVSQPGAGTAGQVFYADAFLFEAASYVGEFFNNFTDAEKITAISKGLSIVPDLDRTVTTGLKADIRIGSLVLNTIDENGVIWVCTDIDGWWTHPEPEVRDIPRGFGDGSYDVRGRYMARQITVSGSFIPPDASYVAAARAKLIEATDLVYSGDWLMTDENPTKASYVRLSGRPSIKTVNPKGRTDFSIEFRAPDPLKYEWWYGEEFGYRHVTIPCKNVSTAATGIAAVTNTGNAYAPVIFEITGPMTGTAVITNETTNESLTIIVSLRAASSFSINYKSLTSNLATLTTSSTHNLHVGDIITVTGVDATFNGQYAVYSVPTATTFTYVKTNANVSGASATGSVAIAADQLYIETKDHLITLNGDSNGKRGLVDVLASWTYMQPGDNIFSFVDNGNSSSTATLAVYYRSAWLG